jgi:hypothetical protein
MAGDARAPGPWFSAPAGTGHMLTHDDGTATWVHFFGDGDGTRFAAMHLPSEPPTAAVVVCSPVYAEMPRNYRREVLLGRELARRGLATLRFHYRGAGNSSGRSEVFGLDTMRADVTCAIRQARRLVGAVPVALVGTRVGAVVAAEAASENGGCPTALWDPVVDAERYFREVFRARLMTELKQGTTGGQTTADLVEELRRTGWVEVAGYPITRELYEGVSSSPLVRSVGPGTGPLLVVEMNRQDRTSKAVGAALSEWRGRGVTVASVVVEHLEAWWFGAGGRDGAVEARVAGEAVVPVTADFLAYHVTGTAAAS